tara:strand:- start:2363 stop:2632 length:270 start_codon:yes stop_codon:yes gene_type:complete
MDIEIESFTYLKDEHLVYLTKDFRTQIYDEKALHIPQWIGGTLIQIVIDFPSGKVEILAEREPSKIYRTDCIYQENYIKEKTEFDEWHL